jgi:hypothetical protein
MVVRDSQLQLALHHRRANRRQHRQCAPGLAPPRRLRGLEPDLVGSTGGSPCGAARANSSDPRQGRLGGVSVRRPYRHRRLQWSAGEHDPHRHVENRRHHAARSRLTLPLTIGIAAGLFYILER